ncbi:branched-chain amino acid-binding protein [Bordetella ansorpii]|uniref:Branched-chain amino acid-binding protein n=1 Tax=Bordetella ansorpii TaxID=288768 RepID=A0A157SPF0_9BORD|nr:ABC transporter substrate-binding protein [Bordetella ansorpii]SAI72378.1 branched-chain amino acid-binding protein [Bordetella ansorpii]
MHRLNVPLPRHAAALAAALAALTLAAAVHAQKAAPPLRIGEINSYKAYPAFLDPYRKGWQLAQEELNASGGVLGRKLQVLSRDDGDRADNAVQAALQLLEKDKVDVLFGGMRSESGLALGGFAAHNKVFYLAAAPMSDQLVWQQGNRYTYRVGLSSRMLVAAVMPKALALRKPRWAIVYPDDETGHGMTATFRSMMQAFQSNAEIVADLPVPAGKFDLRAALGKLEPLHPDALFVALQGNDLARFVREGTALSTFKERAVVAPFAGLPEYLSPLGADAPAGWIVAGYPNKAIDTPGHRRFADAYQARYGAAPQAGSLLGYTTLMALATGIAKAGSATPDALAEAFAGLEVETPLGRIRFRPLDHQSTLGTHVGILAIENGVPAMQSTGYQDGARLQLPDVVVRRLRQADHRAAQSGASEEDAAVAGPAQGSPTDRGPADRAPDASRAAAGDDGAAVPPGPAITRRVPITSRRLSHPIADPSQPSEPGQARPPLAPRPPHPPSQPQQTPPPLQPPPHPNPY